MKGRKEQVSKLNYEIRAQKGSGKAGKELSYRREGARDSRRSGQQGQCQRGAKRGDGC